MFHYNFPVVESVAGNTHNLFCFKGMAATAIVHPGSIISSINNTGYSEYHYLLQKHHQVFCLAIWVIHHFLSLILFYFFIDCIKGKFSLLATFFEKSGTRTECFSDGIQATQANFRFQSQIISANASQPTHLKIFHYTYSLRQFFTSQYLPI